jgi:two-component system chemotaxis response regulator CheB
MRPQPETPGPAHGWNGRIVGVGASAGGVEALTAMAALLPANSPPILIVQHIPAAFVAGLAKHLDEASSAQIQVATDGALLEPGRVYLAPADRHLIVVGSQPGSWRCKLVLGDLVNGFRPSVDVLFESLARSAGDKAVGVILAGMGRDGAQGLLQMRRAGARTLGQNPESSIVYGMPRAAMEVGAVEFQASPERIATRMLQYCRHGTEEQS